MKLNSNAIQWLGIWIVINVLQSIVWRQSWFWPKSSVPPTDLYYYLAFSEGIILINVYHIYGWQTLSFTHIKSGSVCTQTLAQTLTGGSNAFNLSAQQLPKWKYSPRYVHASSLYGFPNGTEYLGQCFISDLSVKCFCTTKLWLYFGIGLALLQWTQAIRNILSNTKLAYSIPRTHFQFGYICCENAHFVCSECVYQTTQDKYFIERTQTHCGIHIAHAR